MAKPIRDPSDWATLVIVPLALALGAIALIGALFWMEGLL